MARHNATPDGNIPFTSEEEAKYDAEEKLAGENFTKFGYIDKRKTEYPAISEQLDMQFWDSENGTTTWKDAIAKVKSDNPKP